MRENVNI